MIHVYYNRLGTERMCECANYTQMLNFISNIRNKVARRLMQPTMVKAYSPEGDLIYLMTPQTH